MAWGFRFALNKGIDGRSIFQHFAGLQIHEQPLGSARSKRSSLGFGLWVLNGIVLTR